MRAFVPILFLLLATSARAADYGIYTGAYLGFGNEGDDRGNVRQLRTMGTLDLHLMPGLRFYGKSVLVGLLADLQFRSQLSDVDTSVVGDFGGNGLLLGPGVVFDFVFGRLLLSYDMRDRQSLKKPDATLKGSGFHFLMGYRATKLLSVDLEYVVSRYNAILQDEIETGLGSSPITHKSFGLGLSISL